MFWVLPSISPWHKVSFLPPWLFTRIFSAPFSVSPSTYQCFSGAPSECSTLAPLWAVLPSELQQPSVCSDPHIYFKWAWLSRGLDGHELSPVDSVRFVSSDSLNSICSTWICHRSSTSISLSKQDVSINATSVYPASQPGLISSLPFPRPQATSNQSYSLNSLLLFFFLIHQFCLQQLLISGY